jgi:hypothetical protein
MAKQKTSNKSTKKTAKKRTLKDKLNEVISEVQSTCKAKGWTCRVESVDDQKWKYASVTVKRWLSGSGEVTGLFNITLNGRAGREKLDRDISDKAALK